MSPLPRIHAATPPDSSRTVLRESASPESGSDSSNSVFADVMRAVYVPARTPHTATYFPQSRSHPDPAKSSNNAKADPSGSLGPTATRQASSGNFVAETTGDGSAERRRPSSISPTGSSVIGSASGLAGEQARLNRSVSLGHAEGNRRSTPATPQKGSLNGSAPARPSTAGSPQQPVQPASGPVLGGTTSPAISAPIGANGRVFITVESNVSRPAGTGNAQKNVSVSNSRAGSSLQPSYLQITAAQRSDAMLRMTDPVAPRIGGASSEEDLIFTRETETGSNPERLSGKDGKQAATNDAGNVRSAASAVPQPGNQNSAAAPSSAGDPAATGSGRDPANCSMNGGGNIAGNNVASAIASVSASSAAAVGNGNATGNPGTSVISSGNRSSASAPNSASTGSVSANVPAGQSRAGTHGTATIPPVEGLRANSANLLSGLHGNSTLVPAPGFASSTGNPTLVHPASSAARGTPTDAFTALDSGTGADHGVLLHTAPHQVSVGVAHPALGWVEVRAERVDGQITAALTADSAASHAALTSVMPSMATYLQDRHAGVQHLHVETGLADGQAGGGSQEQRSPQGDARSPAENLAVPVEGGAGWRGAPTVAEQTSHTATARSTREGYQVSLRA